MHTFNQQEYINDYLRKKYKTIKIRIKNTDKILLDKLQNVDNMNQYITNLIWKDIFDHSEFYYINGDERIDFEVSKTMEDLILKTEKADLMEDYGLYMNLAYAIDSKAKHEVTHHLLTESQWNKLVRRFSI